METLGTDFYLDPEIHGSGNQGGILRFGAWDGGNCKMYSREYSRAYLGTIL